MKRNKNSQFQTINQNECNLETKNSQDDYIKDKNIQIDRFNDLYQ